mgnify:FL=1
MPENSENWLDGRVVVELGGRISVGACGSLLAQAGATVFFVEPVNGAVPAGKFASRRVFSAGKKSLGIDYQNQDDRKLLCELLRKADVVLLSSDWDGPIADDIEAACEGATAVCEFAATGEREDTSFGPLTDATVQAMSGIAYTNGFPGEEPVVLSVPILEYSAGVYGASACVAALETMRQFGQPQEIEVTLFDCAINALSTFLPAVYEGKEPGRLGNGHPMAAPWNAYNAADGWILLCSASDDHWKRVCQTIERGDLANDERFSTLGDRIAHRAMVDDAIAEWVAKHSVDECIASFSSRKLACGAIVKLPELKSEPNVVYRQAIVQVPEKNGETTSFVPGMFLKASTGISSTPMGIPGVDDGRDLARSCRRADLSGESRSNEENITLPLTGVRVLEIGQYTTAPLTARHLASLGAEVIKIEPPSGDAAREWAPKVDGLSVFFAMSNSGKTSYCLDLKTDFGRGAFAELVATADVMVENMKPGSLAAIGFTAERLQEINPKLIYCAITGFGSDSVYENRPAFDTVVQAMSGMMDANAWNGTPLKAGVSACDFMGGEVALFSILSSLHKRAASGRGVVLDLSMQDISVWMTATLWSKETEQTTCKRVLHCSDGYVLLEGAEGVIGRLLDALGSEEISLAEMREKASLEMVTATPISRLSDALKSDVAKSNNPVVSVEGHGGKLWQVLRSPMRMSPTAPAVCAPAGQVLPFNMSTLTMLKGA